MRMRDATYFIKRKRKKEKRVKKERKKKTEIEIEKKLNYDPLSIQKIKEKLKKETHTDD